MDGPRFDRLVKSVATRRSALGLLAGLAGLGLEEAAGKRRRGAAKHSRDDRGGHAARGKPTCGRAGAVCLSADGCCKPLACNAGVCGKAVASCGAGELACGGACCPAVPNGAPTCTQKTCGYTCDPGFTPCSGGCVALGTTDNCGACNDTCSGGKTCQAGTCTCPAGKEFCLGTCVDTGTDAANCGACDSPCPAGASCSNGSCQATCDPGLTSCGGYCVDLTADTYNCGSCGHACTYPASCNLSIDGVSFCSGGGYCRPCTSDAGCAVPGDTNVYYCVDTGTDRCGGGYTTLCLAAW